MYLKDYIKNLNKKYLNIFFSGISFDSSNIKKDNIFFAIKGNKFDGNKFINTAIKKGSKIIISDQKITEKKKNILYIKTKNTRKLLAEFSYKIFNKRPKNLIAVTGTNGKSSIADFFYQILALNSKRVASIGTIGIKHKGKKETLSNTTLDPIKLSLLLKRLYQRNIEYVILEASSHGLKQNRLNGLVFDIGIFTNLSHDHLDYHKSVKDYLNSKLYLFKELIKKKGNVVTDAKIKELKKIEKICNKKKLNLDLIFDKKRGIELIFHKFQDEKQIIKIKFKKKIYKIELNLIGKIQIKNILMSVLAAYQSGLKFKKIINIIKNIKPVEGRLQKIGTIKNNSKVILDYAHTPDALKLALQNLREQFPNRRINLVFGCGGNRDIKKRPIMGKIAEKYSDKIYLTDDNPRKENPISIRRDIKKGIRRSQVEEISDRKKAIEKAIEDLMTGDLLLVAGKGHEKIQDYGTRKIFFSDKSVILKKIKSKNKLLSNNLKVNIIQEQAKVKIPTNIKINNISIDSRNIKKNDIFFAIKGKKLDGNKFIPEVFKKQSSLAIVNYKNNRFTISKQIKVKDTLKFLTKCSEIFRDNNKTKIIAITGSCGKTSLKEMLGSILKKISKTSFSPKSFNNKYGVPLSLFNLKEDDHYGVLEVGMDKKGEIDTLTKTIKPDLAVITNISYAHSKNFKNIKGIAKAKGEIVHNIKPNGSLILNADDDFFDYHRDIAMKKKIKVFSFSIKKNSSFVKLIKVKKNKKGFKILIRVGKEFFSFNSKNSNKSFIYNLLATLTSCSLLNNLKYLDKNIFMNFKTPKGRGDISKLRINNKNIFLVDETYNSNPLSLKIAIENYDKINVNKSKKYLILGDMLELGKYSKNQHIIASKNINKTLINKVYVHGKNIKETFRRLKLDKKARILNKKTEIFDLIKKDLNNNDYLMIKGSNATGLNKITNELKQRSSNAI